MLKMFLDNLKKSLILGKDHPGLFLPFFGLMVFEGIALSLGYYSPRPPLISVFGPLINKFWGQVYLHYPMNFLLLPRLFFIARILIFFLFGHVAYFMVIAGVYQVEVAKSPIRFFGNLNRALRKYFSGLFLLFLAGFCALLVYKVPLIILGRYFHAPEYLGLLEAVIRSFSFIFICGLELFFVFAAVGILLEKTGFWAGLRRAAGRWRENFLPGMIFVALVRSLSLLMSFFKARLPDIVQTNFPLYPEFVLWFLAMDIAVFSISAFLILLVCTRIVVRGRDENE